MAHLIFIFLALAHLQKKKKTKMKNDPYRLHPELLTSELIRRRRRHCGRLRNSARYK